MHVYTEGKATAWGASKADGETEQAGVNLDDAVEQQRRECQVEAPQDNLRHRRHHYLRPLLTFRCLVPHCLTRGAGSLSLVSKVHMRKVLTGMHVSVVTYYSGIRLSTIPKWCCVRDD